MGKIFENNMICTIQFISSFREARIINFNLSYGVSAATGSWVDGGDALTWKKGWWWERSSQRTRFGDYSGAVAMTC